VITVVVAGTSIFFYADALQKQRLDSLHLECCAAGRARALSKFGQTLRAEGVSTRQAPVDFLDEADTASSLWGLGILDFRRRRRGNKDMLQPLLILFQLLTGFHTGSLMFLEPIIVILVVGRLILGKQRIIFCPSVRGNSHPHLRGNFGWPKELHRVVITVVIATVSNLSGVQFFSTPMAVQFFFYASTYFALSKTVR
jgi:hypothetical protein